MKRFINGLFFLMLSAYFISCSKNDNPPASPASQTVEITTVSATSLAEADTLVISGKNFNPSSSGNIVKFNGVNIPVITATSTALTIQIPKGTLTGNAAISVTTNGQTAAYSFNFTRLGTLVTILDATLIGRPEGIAVDASGNLYISDPTNGIIRKRTPNGILSVYAGSAPSAFPIDGPVASATFRRPGLLAIDTNGNLYVVDNYTKLRKISSDGQVSTYTFSMPTAGGIAVDASGNIYATLSTGPAIYKISQTGVLDIVVNAGVGYPDGLGGNTTFMRPTGITCDVASNLYVVDEFRNNIRKITPAGNVLGWAGAIIPGNSDGPAMDAKFNQPCSITIDSKGNTYILDRGNEVIRKIDQTGHVTTVVGRKTFSLAVDGNLNIATLGSSPDGQIAADPSGNLYMIMINSSKVRKVTF